MSSKVHRLKAIEMLTACTALWALSFPVMKALGLAQQNLLPVNGSWFFTSLGVMYRFGLAGLVMAIIFRKDLLSITRREWEQGAMLAGFGVGVEDAADTPSHLVAELFHEVDELLVVELVFADTPGLAVGPYRVRVEMHLEDHADVAAGQQHRGDVARQDLADSVILRRGHQQDVAPVEILSGLDDGQVAQQSAQARNPCLNGGISFHAGILGIRQCHGWPWAPGRG